MPAGLFLRGRIWRFTYSDDIIGGALPTGTIVYANVWGRMEAEEQTIALLEQGLETPQLILALLWPGDMDLHQNDQLEITGPPLSNYYNKKFRVIGLRHASMIDARQFITAIVRHIEESHTNALQ